MNRLFLNIYCFYESYAFYIFKILIVVDPPEHLLKYWGISSFFILLTLLYYISGRNVVLTPLHLFHSYIS